MRPVPTLKQMQRRYRPKPNSIHSYAELAHTISHVNGPEPAEKLIAEAQYWVDRQGRNAGLRAVVTMLEQHFPIDTPIAEAAGRHACTRYMPYVYAIAYPCQQHDLDEVQRAGDWCRCKRTDVARALVDAAVGAAIDDSPENDWLVALAGAYATVEPEII